MTTTTTKPGETLRFLGFKKAYDNRDLLYKLSSLGFAKDVEFTIAHMAPFKGPVVLSVMDTSVMLRLDEFSCLRFEAVH